MDLTPPSHQGNSSSASMMMKLTEHHYDILFKAQGAWFATEESIYYGDHLLLVLFNKTALWFGPCLERQLQENSSTYWLWSVTAKNRSIFESVWKNNFFFKKQQFMRQLQSYKRQENGKKPTEHQFQADWQAHIQSGLFWVWYWSWRCCQIMMMALVQY